VFYTENKSLSNRCAYAWFSTTRALCVIASLLYLCQSLFGVRPDLAFAVPVGGTCSIKKAVCTGRHLSKLFSLIIIRSPTGRSARHDTSRNQNCMEVTKKDTCLYSPALLI
jgi:hypothetical protein